MGGCMGQWVGSGQMTNLIKLELINIIWFCLNIYNLWRHPYLWVDGWVNGWAHVKPPKSNKSWPNRDNSIMDIFDILLDILLKPPQPFIGLFLYLSGCMQDACGFDHMFSLLKRCKYSLYSDTMLNYWSTNHCWTELECSFEWNKHRCTYVHWRIYSSRCSHIAVQVGTEHALEML